MWHLTCQFVPITVLSGHMSSVVKVKPVFKRTSRMETQGKTSFFLMFVDLKWLPLINYQLHRQCWLEEFNGCHQIAVCSMVYLPLVTFTLDFGCYHQVLSKLNIFTSLRSDKCMYKLAIYMIMSHNSYPNLPWCFLNKALPDLTEPLNSKSLVTGALIYRIRGILPDRIYLISLLWVG